MVHDLYTDQQDFKQIEDGFFAVSKKIDSIELINLGTLLHFPAMIFYKNGIREDSARLGYDNQEQIRNLLQNKLKETSK